jgi:enoyl-CoA hydratase/carnithine racemase
MTDSLQTKKYENGVLVITFNRPRALNALNLETMQTFRSTVHELTDDESLRVLILTGAGSRAFCSGGDLLELSQRSSEDDAREFIRIMGDALLTLERLPVPVIAAINGFALGGGSEIALACDMRIVDAKVKLGLVQIGMALTPGWGAGQRLLRIVGYSKTMELLLKGEILAANDLAALGLANHIAPEGKALNFANEIAERPAHVVRGIKLLLQAGLNYNYEAALKIEQDIFPPLWAAEAHSQAVEEFFKGQETK